MEQEKSRTVGEWTENRIKKCEYNADVSVYVP
jgi:hypothetical protein